jgi:glycine/D-amino acid oxidase-like deaminating enzyme
MIETRKTKKGADRYDVVVAGGGTAGWTAALAAARMGKSVLVVERKGCLGGVLSSGLPIHGFFNARHRQVVSGIAEEFVNRLTALGGAKGFTKTDLWFAAYVVTNPAIVRAVIFDMLHEAGVEVLLFAQVVDIVRRGNSLEGIVVQKKSEQELILANTFIDATGDALLCHYAGVPMQEIETLQPPTLVFRVENVDVPALRSYLVAHPEVYMQGRMLPGTSLTKEFLESTLFFYVFQDRIGEVKTTGDYTPLINRFMFTSTPDDQGIVVNMLRGLHVDGKRSESLTEATVHLYRNLVPLVESFRKIIPGFSRCTLCDSEPEIQLRETRRVVGDYTMQTSDVVDGKFFDDTVAVGGYFIDIHSSTDSSGIWKLLENPYGIPYRSLLPQGLDNVLVAGRSISGNRESAASYRVMATCMAMGQAAGTAAAFAGEKGGRVRDIDMGGLKTRLLRDKAILES